MLAQDDADRIRDEEVYRQEIRSHLERDRAPAPGGDPGREYARRLFDSVTRWYESADTKAQVVLTLDGAFLAFLTGSVFSKPEDLAPMLARFTPATWALLAGMALCLAGSVACALLCLWSRLHSRAESERRLAEAGVRAGDAESYAPARSWFFGDVRSLDPAQLARRLETADAAFEIGALAAQAHALSRNVAKKHFWVNRGFLLAGCGLVLFLAAGASYLAAL